MASPELEFGRGSAIPPQKSICDLNLILISSIFSKKVLRFLSHNNIFVIEKLENGTKIDEDGASKQKGGGLVNEGIWPAATPQNKKNVKDSAAVVYVVWSLYTTF